MKRNILIILVSTIAFVLSLNNLLAQNVTMVADINIGSNDSGPFGYIVFNNQLYFHANNGSDGYELMTYNGVNFPYLVADINPADNSFPSNFTIFNNKLYFSADDGVNGTELWVYDGINSPAMVYDINTNPFPFNYSIPNELTVYNNKLYFTVEIGNNAEIWSYDGVNSPSLVNGSSFTLGQGPLHLTVFNNKLYFSARDGINGWKLWEYDGNNPPNVVNGTYTCGSDMIVFNNKLLFVGQGLYEYDGTLPPSIAISSTSSNIFNIFDQFEILNGELYFPAWSNSLGFELWKYDGTNSTLVADIINGPTGSGPTFLKVFNNELFFSADDGIHGYELWKYDGSNPPFLFDINQGPDSSNVIGFTEFNNELYFLADDGIHGKELWKYNPIANNINENETNTFSIYPNPSNEAFYIKNISITDKLYITVTDVTGKIVSHSINFFSEKLEININGSQGVYFINITDKELQKTLKVAKR